MLAEEQGTNRSDTQKKTHSVHSPEGKFYANTRWQTIKLVLDR